MGVVRPMYFSDTVGFVPKRNVSERQTSRHITDIPRRIRNADDSPTARRHFTRTATLNTSNCHAFATSIGTPQGDSLSPVLFTVYLEAALRDEQWCMTRKLLREAARRKQLANVAFHKLSTVWFRRSRISLPLRLRLYESFVVPVLIYNMGTWGLTKAELDRIPPHTTVATYARSSAFTGRTTSRTRRYIAAVDVAPSAKT